MNELKETDPQQMLEYAFRAIYEQEIINEQSRDEESKHLLQYQKEWCNKFIEVFHFVSQYGGRLILNTPSDSHIKLYGEHYSISVVSESGEYNLLVNPPTINSDKCRCLEKLYMSYKSYELTLPEITRHISKGLAKSNADIR